MTRSPIELSWTAKKANSPRVCFDSENHLSELQFHNSLISNLWQILSGSTIRLECVARREVVPDDGELLWAKDGEFIDFNRRGVRWDFMIFFWLDWWACENLRFLSVTHLSMQNFSLDFSNISHSGHQQQKFQIRGNRAKNAFGINGSKSIYAFCIWWFQASFWIWKCKYQRHSREICHTNQPISMPPYI